MQNKVVEKNSFHIITSESVSPGHPDKICDQISDRILDEILKSDPQAKVAVEVLITPNKVFIAGEIHAEIKLSNSEIEALVFDQIQEIWKGAEHAFTPEFNLNDLHITNLLHEQSSDINHAVLHSDHSEGAGDQGMMFGYACGNATHCFMPSSIFYSHKIMRILSQKIKSGELKGLGPDAKCQISMRVPYTATPIMKIYRPNNIITYNGNSKNLDLIKGNIKGNNIQELISQKTQKTTNQNMDNTIDNIVLSVQHHKDLTNSEIRACILNLLSECLPNELICDEKFIRINPSGRFVIGGPAADSGLTGRKIIVDTYGGIAPHGGGAFSGKDPSKVDRSGAYIARYIAKNIVASGLAKECLIQLAYAIGVTAPVSVNVTTFSTSFLDDTKMLKIIQDTFDLSPRGIRNILKLDHPIYTPTATFGHFGRDVIKCKNNVTKISTIDEDGANFNEVNNKNHFKRGNNYVKDCDNNENTSLHKNPLLQNYAKRMSDSTLNVENNEVEDNEEFFKQFSWEDLEYVDILKNIAQSI